MSVNNDRLLLALAAGYRERRPHALLHPYAIAAWTYTMGSDAQRAAFVPHGFADLLWIDGRPWLGGTYRTAVIEQGARGAAVVGIALRPGVIASWARVAAADLMGVRVPLATVLPSLASRLISTVGNETAFARIAARMEETIAADLTRLKVPAAEYAPVTELLSMRHTGLRTVRAMADALGTSERTLRRRCDALFGYGAKTLERILRMQRFLRIAERSPHEGPAALADAAGYSDQSHLTREARVLTGLTPAAIVEQLRTRAA